MTDQLTDHEKRICEDAADKAVAKTFAILGVDINNPADVEDFRKDLRFSGDMRRAMDKGKMAFIGAVAVALAAMLWAGVASSFNKGLH